MLKTVGTGFHVLSQAGASWMLEFPSVNAAVSYVRKLDLVPPAQLTVYDAAGKVVRTVTVA